MLSPLDTNVVRFSQSYTSSPNQLQAPIISNQESPASSSDGAVTSSLLRRASFPDQEEKVLISELPLPRLFR
jgi:hypothetical protein